MAGADSTGTELYTQMGGDTNDMNMEQRPDLYEETNFGGTPEEEPATGGEPPKVPSAEGPATPEAPDLNIIDLGSTQYETLQASQKILVGSISTWVKAIRRAYDYNPTAKTRININDFVLNADGLSLKVIESSGNLRLVRLSNKSRGGYLVLKSVIDRSIIATRQKLSEIFPGIDFTNINLSKEGREILALKNKIPTLTPDASPEDVLQAATAASTAVESLVATAEAGVGVRQEDLGLNIGEFDLRTLQGFDREMQRAKGELRIRLDQLAQTEKDIKDATDHITREERKLQAPDATEDDLADVRNRKRALEDTLKNLQDQREAHLVYIREYSTELRGQFNRIRETVEKVLYGDKTLREKLSTIFREQGVTLTSLTLALALIIETIVLAIEGATGGGGAAAAGGGTTPDPGVPAKAAASMRNALLKLAGWIKALASKSLAALPGIIGTAVSFLLRTAGDAAAWFAKNLWALVVAVILIVVAELRRKKYS
jgi:hypothetical protein